MNRILIALDFNQTAKKVAETGYMLGKCLGAEIYLLHVTGEPLYYASKSFWPTMGFEGPGDRSEVNYRESIKKSSKEYLDHVKNHLLDQTINSIVEEGDTAQLILTNAKELSVDYIVMGSHSRRWHEKILMGSVTEKVLRQTSIPMLIIPTKQG